jgi:aryl-alcohol dehydrogenase-like predicted oxidoreductase
VNQAVKLIDICLERGINFFDTANVYSLGASEEILGRSLKGKRHNAIISTKVLLRSGGGQNDKGSSRYHLIQAAEASVRRLATDFIDV